MTVEELQARLEELEASRDMVLVNFHSHGGAIEEVKRLIDLEQQRAEEKEED